MQKVVCWGIYSSTQDFCGNFMHGLESWVGYEEDVRKKNLRQITTAVGDGGIAGQEAFNYLQTIK